MKYEHRTKNRIICDECGKRFYNGFPEHFFKHVESQHPHKALWKMNDAGINQALREMLR